METIIDISYLKLIIAFIFPLSISIYLSQIGSNLGKDILKSSLLMTLRLVILGFFLMFLLKPEYYKISVFYVFFMLFFAIRTLKQRISFYHKTIYIQGIIALILGSFLLLIYFLLLIIRPTPLINTQYVIPIYGMILGNTLTGLVISINSFNQMITTKSDYYDTLINLGLNPHKIFREISKEIITTGLVPIMTMISTIGFISLPGLMTGQILSGTSPLIAIKYQIAIMFCILGSGAVTILIFIYLLKKKMINKYNQIKFIVK